MKLITKVVVTNSFPLLIDGRLYGMEPGDMLTVSEGPRDQDADITGQTAQTLLRHGALCRAELIQVAAVAVAAIECLDRQAEFIGITDTNSRQ